MSFSISSAAAPGVATQYLLFQIFLGSPQSHSGIYRRVLSSEDLRKVAYRIAALRPERSAAGRILGFAVGPVAMDQGEGDARSAIRDAFQIALESDLAVAVHLDDYMFWAQARWPDGRLLRAARDATEWSDWSETPADGLNVGWLPNVKLAPQLCYESPEVKRFVDYWSKGVIGQEVKEQVDRLVQAGKPQLFAGVIAGWESNLAQGYCSLSRLGYSDKQPPGNFDDERERVLQRHIERWAKGIYDSGIPKEVIFTHLAPIPRSDYEKMTAVLSRARIREMPQSTAFRAFWTAFNPYSNPGFSAYPEQERFKDIHEAVQGQGRIRWAMAEGSNVALGPGMLSETGIRSPLSWESYLARSFNHGAAIVNLFGGFQGEGYGPFQRATESEEALAAYRKFLSGDQLVEDKGR
jgi:hypothetical protein